MDKKNTQSLVLLAEVFLLTLTLSSFSTDLLVILLKSSKIFTGLRELTFFHPLSNVPVHERSFCVHEIKLVVNARQGLGNGGGVGNHAHSALHTGKITTRHHGGRLVVNTALETSGAPVHKLNGSLGLDGGDSSVDILGDNITSVHHTARHVFAVARIALGHHVGRLEHRVGDLSHRELLVVGLLGRDHRGVRGKHKMDTRVGHQVGLELSHIHVEGTIETQGSGK
mmetsp:Transcript_18196/g.25015  ORF Transcript_18196/g.25015 Transcript_18196/m.25015 type:complete len:226 (-) Transcript_18196:711-1388(-)